MARGLVQRFRRFAAGVARRSGDAAGGPARLVAQIALRPVSRLGRLALDVLRRSTPGVVRGPAQSVARFSRALLAQYVSCIALLISTSRSWICSRYSCSPNLKMSPMVM